MKARCNECGKEFETDGSGIDDYCPECGSEDIAEIAEAVIL
jgi:predicted Zn-ribbon and HTH transcriptional regulator